jgi:transcriptional regulator with XRE-family HTH domain
MSMMNFELLEQNGSAERIKLMRVSCNLTRRQFAAISDISAYTLRAWEEGINRLTIKGAEKLETAFRKINKFCSKEWLLNGSGPVPSFGGLNKVSDISGTDVISREMEFFATINPNPFVYKMSDDGMQPNYNPGDFVAGNKVFGDDIKKLDGCECIVMTAENQILCRRLYKNLPNNNYNLACINPRTTVSEPTKFNVELKFAARIVLHRISLA